MISYNYSKLRLLTLIVVNINNKRKIVGLVGIRYKSDSYLREYSNQYHSNVIIDSKYVKQNLGYKGMALLLKYSS